jgi:CRP-like cAMP-binding protein
MADKNGKSVGRQIFIKPFLKHQDIAELTACSRQTVNYILTELRHKDIINFDRKKLVINDLVLLKNYLN